MKRRDFLKSSACLPLLAFVPTLAPPLTEAEKPKYEPPCHEGIIFFDADDPWVLQWIAKEGATPLRVKEKWSPKLWNKRKDHSVLADEWFYITFVSDDEEIPFWVNPKQGNLIPADIWIIPSPPKTPYEFKLISREEAVKLALIPLRDRLKPKPLQPPKGAVPC